MSRSERTRRLRLGAWLVAAVLLGPGCRNAPIGSSDYFLVSNQCTSEGATVTAASENTSESASDTIDASEECQPVGGKALVDVDIDGQAVYVEGVVSRDLESTRISCVHAFTGAVVTSCTVAGTATIELWESGGIGVGTSYVRFEADVSTLGAAPGPPGDPDALVATVTVDCGEGAQAVPVGGAPVLAPIEGFADTCNTSLGMESDVDTPGTNIRVLTVVHQPLSTACDVDAECVETFPGVIEICGPNGSCQAGVEGDDCADRYDCSALAPHCVQGGCWDGSTGDPCWADDDCASGACTALVCD